MPEASQTMAPDFIVRRHLSLTDLLNPASDSESESESEDHTTTADNLSNGEAEEAISFSNCTISDQLDTGTVGGSSDVVTGIVMDDDVQFSQNDYQMSDEGGQNGEPDTVINIQDLLDLSKIAPKALKQSSLASFFAFSSNSTSQKWGASLGHNSDNSGDVVSKGHQRKRAKSEGNSRSSRASQALREKV